MERSLDGRQQPSYCFNLKIRHWMEALFQRLKYHGLVLYYVLEDFLVHSFLVGCQTDLVERNPCCLLLFHNW